MRRSYITTLLGSAMAVLLAPSARAEGAALAGSPFSMIRQHSVALKEDYSFFRTPEQVQRQVDAGRLVRVENGKDYVLSDVSFPETRPEVLAFIQRFASDYRRETGERLVVTSLTRPAALQPKNAHKLSVHPAGMAVDLRVPADATSRAWLERSLLEMERNGLLDVTREKKPAHYHIAVFATPMMAYTARRDSADAVAQAEELELQRRNAVARALAAVSAAADADDPSGSSDVALLAGLSALVLAGFAKLRRTSAPEFDL
jgi:hypothetical protein